MSCGAHTRDARRIGGELNSIGQHKAEGNLPKELCTALWSRVLSRLERGEVLIVNQHFQDALESDFEELTGVEASAAAKTKIRQMVSEVNKRHPETYVAKGVRNAVSRAFDEDVRKLKWDVTKQAAENKKGQAS